MIIISVLTGEEVISAIATNIRNSFSNDEIVAIYKELPIQNVRKPYAFLHQINAEHQNQMRGRARWDIMVDVRVHPKDGQTDVQEWARSIAIKLIDSINTINVAGKPVKSRSIEYRVESDVLHFIVGYFFRVIKAETDGPYMEDLDYGTTNKP